MNEPGLAALLALGAYLLGAVPFGLIIGLARGIDIRKQGSGNIGATNAGRLLGKRWGYLCLLLDILKGAIPTSVARLLLVGGEPSAQTQVFWLMVGVAAVLGHVFPIYLGFRGGKGVATTIGVALGLYPFGTVAIAVALVGYAVVRFALGIVSLGSLTLAVLFPVALLGFLLLTGRALTNYWPFLGAAVLLMLLIVVRHTENIRRLLRGAET